MSWAKLDDAFCTHPKILAVGNAGAGLFARMLSWASAHLTDGVVTRYCATMLEGDDTLVLTTRLVEVGLLEPREDGSFMIHDFGVYNPSAAKEKAKRAKNAERQARHRVTKPVTNAVSNATSNGVSNAVTNAVSNACPVPVPVPVPLNNPDPPNPPSGGTGVGVGDGGGNAPSSPPVRRSNRLWDTLATAYAEGIQEASGSPFAKPSSPRDLQILQETCAAHFGSANTMEAQIELKKSAKEYRTATASAAQYQSGFSPTAWAKWLNAGKPKSSAAPATTKQRSDGVDWTQTPKSKAARAELERRAQEQKEAGVTSLLEGIVDT